MEVYRNLHTGNWSVRLCGGRVIAHLDEVTLRDARFVVREGGRQKVLRERRKNVHAFVRGFIAEAGEDGEAVSYNPYRGPSFYLKGNEQPVSRAGVVRLGQGGQVTAREAA